MNKKTVSDTVIPFIKGSKTDYFIIFPAGPPQSHKTHITVAREISYIYSLSTNLPLIFYDDNSPAGKSAKRFISIGNTRQLKESGIEAPPTGMSGYYIKTQGGNVYICADTAAGLLYGGYAFLEQVMGYRFYACGEIKISKEKNINLKEFDCLDIPDIPSRSSFSCHTAGAYSGQTADRLKFNGCYMQGFANTWSSLSDQSLVNQLVPWQEFYDRYPDWYWQDPEAGQQGWVAVQKQINYSKAYYDKFAYEKGDTAEDNYDDGRHGLFWTVMYRLIKNFIAEEPEKIFFILGIGDNIYYDKSQLSLADYKKYTVSGTMMRFVNAVADEVKEWQEKNAPNREINIVTFAYKAFLDPPCKKDEKGNYIADESGKFIPVDPSVVARDNVVIRYAPIHAGHMYPYIDRDNNPGSANALTGWSSVAGKLSVWDYWADFSNYFIPFPWWFCAQENIKTYRDYGFIDVMHQGAQKTRGTAFAELNDYIRSRLLWDVNLDYAALTDEFMNEYYKEAAPALKKYLEFLKGHYTGHMRERGYTGRHRANPSTQEFFPYGVIVEIEQIFAGAYALIEPLKAEQTERYVKLKGRIDKESLFYRYMLLNSFPEHFKTAAEKNSSIDLFEELCDRVGMVITAGSIGKTVHEYISEWRS